MDWYPDPLNDSLPMQLREAPPPWPKERPEPEPTPWEIRVRLEAIGFQLLR